ncbi:hypothetical protein ABW21_db0200716 [Orbilia brochopaga]|nr:hypothetical protein ABW21_db0200716 [Drechslerella brochopaga]
MVTWAELCPVVVSNIFNNEIRRIRGAERHRKEAEQGATITDADSFVEHLWINTPLTDYRTRSLGSIAGNPADIINVRMQQDGALPAEKQRNYKNAIDGLIKMVRQEGVTSLFRGVGPNSGRGALMTASQLASYDEFKMLLLRSGMFEDNLTTHFTVRIAKLQIINGGRRLANVEQASTMAGGVATLICSPVDVVKTKIMSSHDPAVSLLDLRVFYI